MYITSPPVNNSMYLYYCTHGCVCELDNKDKKLSYRRETARQLPI